MITAVNTQALAASVSGGASSRQAERPDAEQAIKALDSGDKGYLSADDLQAAVVKISAEGARRADAAGRSAPSAQEMIAQLDGDGDGKVTQQEFKAAEPKAPPSGGAQGAKPAGGQPPAGAAGAGGGSKTASSTETYEAADTNEDGKVSAQEQRAYDAKLAAEKAAAQAASSGRNVEADAAVKAYEAVEQLGQDTAAA